MNTWLIPIVASIFSLLCFGCAGTGGGLGSVAKTNQLMPGMTLTQVQGILGDPSQTQFIAEKLIWKYSLHEPWKGWVPYYLVFDKDVRQLQAWYADEAEYLRQQKLWLQAFPPTQKRDVDINIRQK